MTDLGDQQRGYWSARASSNLPPRSVSIADPWQRDLEIAFITSHLTASDSVLEVGCGNGEMSRKLHGQVSSLTAIDFSAAMVERARIDTPLEVGIDFRQGDATRLAAADSTFDAVVCSRVLINMPTRHLQERAVSEFHRVLRPGGRLILLEGRGESFEGLNFLRELVGLQPIQPAAVNLYLDDEFFSKVLSPLFYVKSSFDIGLYDILTRVLLPRLNDDLEGEDAQEFKDVIVRLVTAVPPLHLAQFSRLVGGCFIRDK